MKALELLRKATYNGEYEGVALNMWDIEEVYEAIAELEELQNRTCESCKSFQFWSETKDISSWDSHWVDLGLCNNGVQSGCFNSTVDKYFCCNRYKQKDNQ